MKCTTCGSESLRWDITFGIPNTRITCEECGNKEVRNHNLPECVQNGHDWELIGGYFVCRRCALFAKVKIPPEVAYFKQFSGE
jgi:late competence protein required for DNA uptake (superfamily II DNA/RNA helicase)